MKTDYDPEQRACDRCGCIEDLKTFGPYWEGGPSWDYCAPHAALQDEYDDGRRTMALLMLDQAVTLCLDEHFTEDQIRKALEIRVTEGARVSLPETVAAGAVA